MKNYIIADSKCVLNAFFVQIKFDAKKCDRVCTAKTAKKYTEFSH